jgi:AcrR family transcriptional regulator
MQNRSRETRQRILTAALLVFAQNGYDASGVAEICSQAGVSKGAFYHHFPSKQAVFMSLLTEWLQTLDRQLALIHQENETIPQTLLEMTNLMQGLFNNARSYLPVFLEFWAQAIREPQVWQALISPYHRYQEFFTGLMSEGIAQGSLKPIDPKVAAVTVVSLAVGLLLQGLLDPSGENWAGITQESFNALLYGIVENNP